MTISSTSRKAGPFSGTGSQTAFAFTYKVFEAADLLVVLTDDSGTETTLTLTTHYTVTLNSDQDSSPGGTVNMVTAPASGYLLTLGSQVAQTQTLELTNAGGFYPTVINDALDRMTSLTQQLSEEVDRSVKVGFSSSMSSDELVASIETSASEAAVSAASAAASLETFQGQYYGVLAADPTVDLLGNVCTAGDLYFSSTLTTMRVYTGSAWQDVTQSVSLPYVVFSGTGAQTAFTLTSAPGALNNLEPFISGVRQRPTLDYTLSGTTLTFTTAPPIGTSNIFVRWITAQSVGVPSDGSVTTAKIADSAVTSAKLAPAVTDQLKQLQSISASVASNAITISAAQLTLDFRSTTLASGTVTTVTGTPANLTLAATDSFGLTTAYGSQRIAILAINNAGTIELAASALYGGVSLDETGVITTAATSTTATAIKAANVRTGVAYRVIGFVDATFTTATGWGSLARVQGQGGQALADMSSLGYGQTWQNLTASRTLGTTYYNATGKPILLMIHNVGGTTLTVTINGSAFGTTTQAVSSNVQQTYLVPPSASYSAAASSITSWFELR